MYTCDSLTQPIYWNQASGTYLTSVIWMNEEVASDVVDISKWSCWHKVRAPLPSPKETMKWNSKNRIYKSENEIQWCQLSFLLIYRSCLICKFVGQLQQNKLSTHQNSNDITCDFILWDVESHKEHLKTLWEDIPGGKR